MASCNLVITTCRLWQQHVAMDGNNWIDLDAIDRRIPSRALHRPQTTQALNAACASPLMRTLLHARLPEPTLAVNAPKRRATPPER